MSEERPIRIGIVGLGTIGRIHATRLQQLGATVVGADLDPAARESFADEFDADVFPDHETLLETDVDAVIVGVPNRFHEPVAVDALDAGADVLLEKPLAHTLESAERIAEAARHSSGFCMVGFTMRFSDQTARTRQLRDDGQFGSLSHVSVDYRRRGGVPGGGRGWFTDPELAGGGVLMDLGVHIIDLALHLLGYPSVEEVSGITRSTYDSYEVDDSASALIRCADERTVAVDTSWHGTTTPSRECALRGTDAGVEFTVGGSEVTLVTADAAADPTTISVEEMDMHLAEDRAFLAGVAGDRDDLGSTVEDALVVQRIIDAIYESSDKGRAIDLEKS